MKNFKKVLAVMTAAASLVMSTSALAADNEVAFNASTDTYSTGLAGSYAEGKFTVSGTPTVSAGTEMTLLILKEGTDEANVTNDDILYIDQVTEGTEGAFTGMGLKTDIALAVTEADGHIVKLGYKDSTGTFRIAEGNILVTAATEEDTGITVLWGDIDVSGKVDVTDASVIVDKLLGGTSKYGDFTIGENATVKAKTAE